MDKYVEKFLYRLVAKSDIKNEKTTIKDVILAAINNACYDMLIGGRFVIGGIDDFQKAQIYEAFASHKYIFDISLIDEVGEIITSKCESLSKGNRSVTKFGLGQKVVNMTYKYLYVFNDILCEKGLVIDYRNCDCPLDSIILSRKELGYSGNPWTRITKEEYDRVQNAIHKIVDVNPLGNLKYDFEYWE